MKKNRENHHPVALTIAGSDSGGGAGIQADLRTFSRFQVYGCSAVTVVTSQNPFEVTRIEPLPAECVESQISAVAGRFNIGALKTGMLFNREIILAVARGLRQFGEAPLVCDPVMLSTSGAALLEKSAAELLMNKILPLARWVTPNIPEAEVLSGTAIKTLPEMAKAAESISRKWGCRCIVKGGHLAGGKNAIDVVCCEGSFFKLSSPLAEAGGVCGHGTGCTFSAAIAANFAKGASWQDSLCEAKAFVYGSLVEKVGPGLGFKAMFPPEKDYMGKILLESFSPY